MGPWFLVRSYLPRPWAVLIPHEHLTCDVLGTLERHANINAQIR